MLESLHTSVYEYNYDHVSRMDELDSDEFGGLVLKEDVLYTLTLNNVVSLNQSDCANLVKFKGSVIELNGLKGISSEVAEILIKFNGSLCLGIETIESVVAKTLSIHSGALSLTKLTSINNLALGYLSTYQGNVIEFDSLKAISKEQAAILVTYQGEYLSLDGLTEISVSVAKELSRYPGFLFLSGLRELPVDIAKELVNHTGSLSLDGLSTISDEVAAILSFKGGNYLELKGLKKISDKAKSYLKSANIEVKIN